MQTFWHNLKQLLIALDQVINVLVSLVSGNKGWADETMSARAWRHYERGEREWVKTLIDTLFWFDKNHCYESYLSEIERRHSPPESRK